MAFKFMEIMDKYFKEIHEEIVKAFKELKEMVK